MRDPAASMPGRYSDCIPFVARTYGIREDVRERFRRQPAMMRLLYTTALYCAAPFLVLRLAWRGIRDPLYRQRIGERFGFGPRIDAQRGCVWIHAVSVGEVQAAAPIVTALKDLDTDQTIVVTSATTAGAACISKVFGSRVLRRWHPFDLPGATARFLRRVDPRVAVVMGTEVRPNMLARCRGSGVPVVLANVRLSERSVSGYRRLRPLFVPALRGVAAIAVQSGEDARRMESIGAPAEVIGVTGTTRFDVPVPASLREEAAALRRIWGSSRGIWIAATTYEGEESQVLDAFEQVLRHLPASLLVLVPRQPERFRDVAALARRRGLIALMRTDRPVECSGAQVFIGNTMGELPLFYAASDVAFVGGTLVERGGHNMLEPATLGLPVLYGPHVFNFAEIARSLVDAGGAETVGDSESLGRAVVRYLTDAELRHNTGANGLEFVERNRGAGDRVLAMIRDHLEPPPPPLSSTRPGLVTTTRRQF